MVSSMPVPRWHNNYVCHLKHTYHTGQIHIWAHSFQPVHCIAGLIHDHWAHSSHSEQPARCPPPTHHYTGGRSNQVAASSWTHPRPNTHTWTWETSIWSSLRKTRPAVFLFQSVFSRLLFCWTARWILANRNGYLTCWHWTGSWSRQVNCNTTAFSWVPSHTDISDKLLLQISFHTECFWCNHFR